MCKFIGKSNERILCKLSKKEILRLYSIVPVAMETTKTSNFNRQSKWIPIVSEISDFSSGIPDSKAQDSGFHKEIFLTVRIPQAKISRISESGLPYMERLGNVVRRLYYCAYMSRFVQTFIWF